MPISVSLKDWKPWIGKAVTVFNTQFPALSWGTYPGHDPSEDRATDGMVPAWNTVAGRAFGWVVAQWVWANRKKYNVWYVIFDGKIISQTRPAAGWAPYFARNDPNPSKSHKNHVHVSFYANDPGGITTAPGPVLTNWDGKSFPGAQYFYVGAQGAYVTWLGERLVKHGYTGYMVGPGAEFHPNDQKGVRRFQEKQGWTGSDADGIPGPETWKRLAADPAPVVPPPVIKPPVVTPPTSQPDPKPEVPVSVTLTHVQSNPLWNNDDRGGGWPKRVDPLVKQYLSLKPDTISVCEIDPQQAADIYKRLPAGWSYWRINGGSKYGPLAIYWRQAVLERQGNALEHEFSDNDSRFLLSVPLTIKATGETIWVDGTHYENNGSDKARAAKRRKLQGVETAARTKAGRRIGGGDLNSTTLASGSDTTKPRVIMGKAGLKLLTSQPSSKVANRALASHHSDLKARPKGAWIDDIWWRGVTFNKGGLLPTSYSDHHILWANFTI